MDGKIAPEKEDFGGAAKLGDGGEDKIIEKHGRKRCYLGNRNKGKTKELWEDVYAAWIRYRLTEPLQDGRIHEKDEENMRRTWGHHLHILTVDAQEK